MYMNILKNKLCLKMIVSQTRLKIFQRIPLLNVTLSMPLCTSGRISQSQSLSNSRRLKHTFIVIAKDKPNASENRSKARNAHLQKASEAYAASILHLGGALLKSEHGEGVTNMSGSVLLYEADSIEQVREWVQKDPYTLGNVWGDVEIHPFKIARFRKEE
jgi:uncharacterized protein